MKKKNRKGQTRPRAGKGRAGQGGEWGGRQPGAPLLALLLLLLLVRIEGHRRAPSLSPFSHVLYHSLALHPRPHPHTHHQVQLPPSVVEVEVVIRRSRRCVP